MNNRITQLPKYPKPNLTCEECRDIVQFLVENTDFSESSKEYKAKVIAFLFSIIAPLPKK